MQTEQLHTSIYLSIYIYDICKDNVICAVAVAHCHNSITSSARQENYARWAEPSQRNMSTFARNPKIRAGAVEPNNIIALTGAALRKTHHDTLNHGPVHPVKTQPPEA